MNKKQFLRIIRKNKEEVTKWANWKQRITISAKNAKTGRYYDE